MTPSPSPSQLLQNLFERNTENEARIQAILNTTLPSPCLPSAATNFYALVQWMLSTHKSPYDYMCMDLADIFSHSTSGVIDVIEHLEHALFDDGQLTFYSSPFTKNSLPSFTLFTWDDLEELQKHVIDPSLRESFDRRARVIPRLNDPRFLFTLHSEMTIPEFLEAHKS